MTTEPLYSVAATGNLRVEIEPSGNIVLRLHHLPPTPDTVITVTDAARLVDALLTARSMVEPMLAVQRLNRRRTL